MLVKSSQPAFQIFTVPEQLLVRIFPSNYSGQSFGEGI